MNELCRVLKPGGLSMFVFPSYPHIDSITDPTHINLITKKTVDYFIGNHQVGDYAGINTKYILIKNKKIRRRKKFDPSFTEESDISIRRKVSLLKRDLLTFINPSHRVWILKKIISN
jgi:hypothetical protein